MKGIDMKNIEIGNKVSVNSKGTTVVGIVCDIVDEGHYAWIETSSCIIKSDLKNIKNI
jgi:hypothetical protein